MTGAPATAWRAAVLAAVLGAASLPAGAETLYAQLGERPGIESLMDDFVARLKADARIGAHFRDTKASHLARQLRDQVCELAGGPCRYDGPTMAQAHDGMAIARRDFNALVELLQDAMDARGVPFPAQRRLLARLAPLHREIVAAPE